MLRVEIQTSFPVEVVDCLSCSNLLFELVCNTFTLCEERNAIAILVPVDEFDCFFDCVDFKAHKHRPENFLVVAFHVGFDICYHRGTNLLQCQPTIFVAESVSR